MMSFVVCALLVFSLASAQLGQNPQAQQPSPQQPLPQQPQQPSPQQPSPRQPSSPSTSTQSSSQLPLPPQPAQGRDQGQDQHDALRLRCQAENGTVPYWLDSTCRTYLSCTSFNLSLERCADGRVYSYPHRSCLVEEQVNCSAQNEEFSAIIQALLTPHFYQNIGRPTIPLVPFSANNAAAVNPPQPGTQEDSLVDEGYDEEVDEVEMTIDLDDLPSILVDTTNAFNVTLPAETCQRLENQTLQLETSMNAALLMLVGCPERSCDVPLIHLDC